MRANFVGTSGAKRERLGTSTRATAAEGRASRDSDSRVWPPPSSRSVETYSASYDRIDTSGSAGCAEVQPRRQPPLDTANDGGWPDDISRCSLSSLIASAVLARSLFPSSAR